MFSIWNSNSDLRLDMPLLLNHLVSLNSFYFFLWKSKKGLCPKCLWHK